MWHFCHLSCCVRATAVMDVRRLVQRVACRIGFSGWAEFEAEVVAIKVCQAFAAGIICEADTTRAVRTGFNRFTAAGGDFTISVLIIGNSGRC